MAKKDDKVKDQEVKEYLRDVESNEIAEKAAQRVVKAHKKHKNNKSVGKVARNHHKKSVIP